MKAKILFLMIPFLFLILETGCSDDESNNEIQPVDQITFDNVEILNDVLPPGYYTTIRFTSQNTAYTITTKGEIFKTEDEGNTWEQQNSGTELHLYDMFFLNDLQGYIAGGNEEGIILKTMDGGNTWVPTNFHTGLSTICFIDETTGFTAGGGLFKTQDGGKTWQEINLGFLNYRKIIFFNKKEGLLTAVIPETLERIVLKTTDGGLNWVKLNNVSLDLYTITKIQILNQIAYLIPMGEEVFKTQDMGKTWQVISTPGVNSAYFINERQAVGVGQRWPELGYFSSGIIYITNDGGEHWEEKLTRGIEEFYSLTDIDFSNDSTALAVGHTNKGCVVKLRF